jgi:hypothetical protein
MKARYNINFDIDIDEKWYPEGSTPQEIATIEENAIRDQRGNGSVISDLLDGGVNNFAVYIEVINE